jgi:hypothetical protein
MLIDTNRFLKRQDPGAHSEGALSAEAGDARVSRVFEMVEGAFEGDLDLCLGFVGSLTGLP